MVMKNETPEQREKRIAYLAQYRLENRPVKFKKEKKKKIKPSQCSDDDKSTDVLLAKERYQKQQDLDKKLLSDSAGFTRYMNKIPRTRS